jgi:hypothetical protein
MIICEPWWAVSLSFICTIITGSSLPLAWFFIIGFILLPIGIQFWIMILTDLVFSQKQKEIRLVFATINIIFEIIYIILYFIDFSLLGTPVGTFDVDYSIYMLIYLMILLIIILLTGTKFALESMKSGNPEIKLKGKFLLMAFYSFVIGSFVSILSASNITILIIAKIIVITSSIEFYLGFVLPEFIKKRLIK